VAIVHAESKYSTKGRREFKTSNKKVGVDRTRINGYEIGFYRGGIEGFILKDLELKARPLDRYYPPRKGKKISRNGHTSCSYDLLASIFIKWPQSNVAIWKEMGRKNDSLQKLAAKGSARISWV
jgi:hypothetical protein